MTRKILNASDQRILLEMLSLPTAPFAEHRVIEYIERFCAKRANLTLKPDEAGNMLIRVRKGNRRVARPVCITAHLDHPGFVADRMISKQRLRANWRGGVSKEYFVGSRVRFHVGDAKVRGCVRSVKSAKADGRERVVSAIIDTSADVPPELIGMWDLPAPKIRGSRIHAGPCDDLSGAAAMLCAMDRLARGAKSCDAYFLFTRAEEVGFVGAIASVRLKTIPRQSYVVAMETSSELPYARMGDGPILRVGDRATTFTSAATAHCNRVAQDLTAADRGFRFQRKLMDGGMCESTAYCELGHDATGLCLALGNYHNMDIKRKRIAPEFIDLTDFHNVVKWFVELGRTRVAYTGRDDALRKRLRGIERKTSSLLRASHTKPR